MTETPLRIDDHEDDRSGGNADLEPRQANARSAKTRRQWLTASAVLGAVAVVLSAGYFPVYFRYLSEDGSYLLVSLRNFLDHGDLYGQTSSQYGPFYYLAMSPLYWITGHVPTLDNSRVLVLLMTALTAALFGASVWRIARRLPYAVLAEVVSFLILAERVSEAPMHPGSLVALALAGLTFALASWAISGGWISLLGAGIAIGALLAIKINVGLLALGGLVLALTVGNRSVPRSIQYVVILLVAGGPFILIKDNYLEPWVVFAAVTALAVIALSATLSSDLIQFRLRSAALVASGIVVVVLLSVVFLLLTGSGFSNVMDGVIRAPLRNPRVFASYRLLPGETLHWIPIVVTVVGLVILLPRLRKKPESEPTSAKSSSWSLALVALSLVLLGVSIQGFEQFASWLPVLSLLPALALLASASEPTRRALRVLLPIAILQAWHVYPAVGYQTAWATVGVVVPVALAGAAGIERIREWNQTYSWVRATVVLALAVLIAFAMNFWPQQLWSNYLETPALDLPGARLVHLDGNWPFNPPVRELRQTTAALRNNCDAFYSSPGLGYFYVFTKLPPVDAPFEVSWPIFLDDRSQRLVVTKLEQRALVGQRVCYLTTGDVRFGGEQLDDPLVKYFERFNWFLRVGFSYWIRVIPTPSMTFP